MEKTSGNVEVSSLLSGGKADDQFLAGSQGPGGTRMRNRIHPVWV